MIVGSIPLIALSYSQEAADLGPKLSSLTGGSG